MLFSELFPTFMMLVGFVVAGWLVVLGRQARGDDAGQAGLSAVPVPITVPRRGASAETTTW